MSDTGEQLPPSRITQHPPAGIRFDTSPVTPDPAQIPEIDPTVVRGRHP